MTSVVAQAAPDYALRALEFFSFRYDFVATALGASVVVGLMCGVVGTFLVLRGYSLLGDAAGHATLPGVCLGFLAAGGAKVMGALLAGALISALAAAVLVGAISRRPRTREDAAIGIVLSVFFGGGIVLLSYIQNTATGGHAGLSSFLYGNAAGATPTQLLVLCSAATILIGAVAIFWRPLTLSIFDPIYASVRGIPVRTVHLALLGALAVSVVLSIEAVGVVLVSAMLVIPPSTALLVSHRLGRVAVLSGGLGAFAGACGALASYVFEGVSTGPAMVLASGALFGFALLLGPRGGLFRHRGRAGGRAYA